MPVIFNNSSVGILVYMLQMSIDASFKLGSKGLSDRSFINWTELWTLYTYGSGIYIFSLRTFLLTYRKGHLIGRSFLCTLTSPLNDGVSGLSLLISICCLSPLFACNYLVCFWDILKHGSNVVDFDGFVVWYEVQDFLVVIFMVYYYYHVSFVRLCYYCLVFSLFVFDLVDKFQFFFNFLGGMYLV
jgi:hypothetical protein